MERGRRILLRLPSLCLGALVVGCSSSSDGGDIESNLPDEELGTALTAPGELDPQFGALVWSPDGTEIYYTSDPHVSGQSTIKSLTIADGEIRVLDPRARQRGYAPTVSANGHSICHESLDPYGSVGPYGDGYRYPSLECISRDGQPTVLVADHVAYQSPAFGSNDSILAYGIAGPVCTTEFGESRCDTVAVYNFRTQATSRMLRGIPLAIAPDGDGLLYHERPCDERAGQNTCRTLELSLATGISTPVWSGELDDHGQRWRWDSEGPRYVAWIGEGQGISIVVRHLESHTTDLLLQLNSAGKHEGVRPWNDQFTWSANGHQIGFWVEVTIPGPLTWLVLHVIDVPSRHDAAVALVTSADAGGVAFSPDGHRVAYVVGSRMYAHSLP